MTVPQYHKVCHPERRAKPGVEGSSHPVSAVLSVCVKILRLPAVAQDDKSVVFSNSPERVPHISFLCGTVVTVPYIWFFGCHRRKNPTTFPGIMLSEMPIAAEIILPLGRGPCIMIMTDYTVYLDIWR